MNRVLFTLILLAPVFAHAQGERADIRLGNKLFEQGKFTESEKAYSDALAKNNSSKEAAFNLAGSMYKQSRWADATALYGELAKSADPLVNFNLGNTYFQERKLDEAIESYKTSLRTNPSDMEAKFNLAYAQKLKKEQDQNKDQNQQNQDQDQNKQDQKQDQNKDQGQKQDQKQQEQPKPQSRQDAERMLKAIQAAEDKTKEKVDQQKVETTSKGSSKNW